MRGRGSIPAELREVLSILDGQRVEHPDPPELRNKRGWRERLILRFIAEHVPFPAGETREGFQRAYTEAFQRARREHPDWFRIRLPKPRENKADVRRHQEAGRLLRDWLREWSACGHSTALLMFRRSDIERAMKKWWGLRKHFDWPTLPGDVRAAMYADARPTAEAIACRALWAALTHPQGARFIECQDCGRIFYATRLGKRPRLHCSNPACGSRNSSKPYMVKAEERKLQAVRQLLPRVKDKSNWKSWILAQPAALNAEITSRWLTRRINENKLSLPDSLEGTR